MGSAMGHLESYQKSSIWESMALLSPSGPSHSTRNIAVTMHTCLGAQQRPESKTNAHGAATCRRCIEWREMPAMVGGSRCTIGEAGWVVGEWSGPGGL